MERTAVLLFCLSMVDGHVNFSKQYELLEISQSTKKKDRQNFLQELQKQQLKFQSFRGKGVTITGDELTLRIQTTQIISQIIELDEQNRIVVRKANNPLQTLIYERVKKIFKNK